MEVVCLCYQTWLCFISVVAFNNAVSLYYEKKKKHNEERKRNYFPVSFSLTEGLATQTSQCCNAVSEEKTHLIIRDCTAAE